MKIILLDKKCKLGSPTSTLKIYILCINIGNKTHIWQEMYLVLKVQFIIVFAVNLLKHVLEYVEKWTNLSMMSRIGIVKPSFTNLVDCTRYNRVDAFSLSKEYTRWLSRTTRSLLLMPVSNANYMKYLVLLHILQHINWSIMAIFPTLHLKLPLAKQKIYGCLKDRILFSILVAELITSKRSKGRKRLLIMTDSSGIKIITDQSS